MKPLHRVLILAIAASLLFTSGAVAQVTFSGDARIRPRIDIDDRTGDAALPVPYSATQFYYMYRLRLNMLADMGDGYFVRSRLAHNGVGFYQKGGEGKLPDIFGNDANAASNESARRPELDFSYLYFGRATDTFGFEAGLIPVPGYSNPLWDLHYYPNIMVNVPFFVLNTDGAFGGRAYMDLGPGRLTVHALLDRESEESREDEDGQTLSDAGDQYTLAAAYAIPVSGFSIEPTLMKALPLETRQLPGTVFETTASYNAPLTLGVNVVMPEFSGLTPSVTAGYTTSSEGATADAPVPDYTGWLARAKLAGPIGPGGLTAWFDYGQRTDEAAGGDIDYSFFFTWINYTFTIYDGDHGAFRIGPTYRFANYARTEDDSAYRSRHMIEINFDAIFR